MPPPPLLHSSSLLILLLLLLLFSSSMVSALGVQCIPPRSRAVAATPHIFSILSLSLFLSHILILFAHFVSLSVSLNSIPPLAFAAAAAAAALLLVLPRLFVTIKMLRALLKLAKALLSPRSLQCCSYFLLLLLLTHILHTLARRAYEPLYLKRFYTYIYIHTPRAGISDFSILISEIGLYWLLIVSAVIRTLGSI